MAYCHAMIRQPPLLMAFSTALRVRIHMLPISLACGITAGAIALVAYLLWPTWSANGSSTPERLPVSVGGTVFNVPTGAVRMTIQRHSGPQERVDLAFGYPSLDSADAPKHVTAETVEQVDRSIDRIFLSIAAHHDALAPDMRVRTIYPRYLDQASPPPRCRIGGGRVSRQHALQRRRSVCRR